MTLKYVCGEEKVLIILFSKESLTLKKIES